MRRIDKIKSIELTEDLNNHFVEKLVNEIESVENNPFENVSQNIKLISSEQFYIYNASYHILSEERNYDTIFEPSTKELNSLTPEVNDQNIKIWDYKLRNEGFYDHEVKYLVPNSSYIETCNSCKGQGKVRCYDCNGNGNCSKCIGSGQISCSCGNGNCSNCAGKGEIACKNSTCRRGVCSKCNGSGTEIRSGKSERCHTCFGTGSCRVCAGKGFTKCYTCSGSGKHAQCNGSGKNKCNACGGKGRCKRCYGGGEITCSRCKGHEKLIKSIEIRSLFSNSLESSTFVPNDFVTTNEINVNEIYEKSEILKEITDDKFEIGSLENFSEINEINNFLKSRKTSFISENIVSENIKIICLPVTRVTYEFNETTYTSYFVGNKEVHYFESNPILDYSIKLEETISKLIKETNYSQAIRLLIEQEARYSSIGDIEKSNNCKSEKESLKVEIQKDLVRGSFFAQMSIALLDVFVLYYLIFNCLTPTKKDIISLFLVTTVSFILIRFGYYLKYLAPIRILRSQNTIEQNQLLNGDQNASFYFLDSKVLKWTRIIGNFSLVVTFIDSYGKNTVEPYVSSIFVFFLAFLLSLLSNIFLDINYNRKISNSIDKLSTSKSRILRSYLISVCAGILINLTVLLLGSFIINPDIDYNALSASECLQFISMILFFVFIIHLGFLTLFVRKKLTNPSKTEVRGKLTTILKYLLIGIIILGIGYFVFEFVSNKPVKEETNRIEANDVAKQIPKKNTIKKTNGLEKTTTENDETAIYFQYLLGDYSGQFGNKKLQIHIEEIDSINNLVSGWNLVGRNKRPISGSISANDDSFTFSLSEPGDDKYDGIFEFKIYKNSINTIEGQWNSNDGTLSRDFSLSRL